MSTETLKANINFLKRSIGTLYISFKSQAKQIFFISLKIDFSGITKTGYGKLFAAEAAWLPMKNRSKSLLLPELMIIAEGFLSLHSDLNLSVRIPISAPT